ncbi:MAG: hypothetical protein FWC21_02220 [Treponema sp.]|nr:hypothetical protein [Treponema sp.]
MKFKSQLRKTRPDIVKNIDDSLVRSINNAGGKITGDRFVISAVFNEDTIGFWLDMFILTESLTKNIGEYRELFGFSLIICDKFPESPEMLCRYLSSYNGVFIDEKAAKKMVPYASFEKPPEWMRKNKKRRYSSGNFFKIKEFKTFKSVNKNDIVFYNEIIKIFEQENRKNVLILGPFYWQIRGGLYSFIEKLNGHFPPLLICFDSIGLGSLVDIWSHGIRSLSGNTHTEEIDSSWEFLFRERIRFGISEYIYKRAKAFLQLVFVFYAAAAVKKKKTPVLLLENVHLADNDIMNLLIESVEQFNLGARQKILLYGTGDADINSGKLKQCDSLFDIIKKIKNTKTDPLFYPALSLDLWEIIYSISLFAVFYPPELTAQLLEEEGKNPEMIAKAFSILHSLGIINSTSEPRLMKIHFIEYSRNVIGINAARVDALVYGRLLDWTLKRKLNACYRLLTIITGFKPVSREISSEERLFISENLIAEDQFNDTKKPPEDLNPPKKALIKIDDTLVLKSIFSDIVSETTGSIETAISAGEFDQLLNDRSDIMKLIYKTSMALCGGSGEDIENIFNENNQLEKISGEYDSLPALKAQIIVNHCAYYLGHYNEKKASEKAKEAILLGQRNNTFSLPQSYRLYSLVCLSKQRIDETIEYIGFALTNAEKAGNYYEYSICAYYAAVTHFLYGDIFKAVKFTRKSIEQALLAGSPEWADRSRFFLGRVEFELGRYNEALEIFEKLGKEPHGRRAPDKLNLLVAWIYRCKIYTQSPYIPRPDIVIHDADIFEIEASYLSGNYQKAVELCASYVNPFSNESFLYIERPDWRSGFAQCEHLYFYHGEIQNRMISLFNALSLSALSKTAFSKSNEFAGRALEEIQNILRDDRLCEMDPWAAFYYYAKYRILEQTGANQVDMSTSVSMAFKRLQRRATRIEDSETRGQYLTGPRWNRELNQAAKEFKLI